ncbi:hypothetical protein [Amycolatopsis silviterrae]|uniref:Uncharacterized protein n=1 Tax=Amycolatopsis silviterrae TaxID=1656914 RepID=A0ABW5H346_9PSEU
MTTTSAGARQFQAVLQWRHPDGPAHCLLRVHLPGEGQATAVVSQVRSNSDDRGIGMFFPDVAGSALAALPPDAVGDPGTMVWIAHYGEFSSYDSYAAPEVFVRVALGWDGTRFHGDLEGQDVLSREDADRLLAGVVLDPVPEVLGELGWRY